uniref:Phosphoenolpyruvate carboxykinase C-terminal P-loop domain-containing protein n=1 Tax=Glossina brevipalpis TaxID=37001 RepID=A0A1A9WLN1_9MUSC
MAAIDRGKEEKYFNKLEKKEALEEKMLNTYSLYLYVHLSSLLPYLPILMDPFVCALNDLNTLVSQKRQNWEVIRCLLVASINLDDEINVFLHPNFLDDNIVNVLLPLRKFYYSSKSRPVPVQTIVFNEWHRSFGPVCMGHEEKKLCKPGQLCIGLILGTSANTFNAIGIKYRNAKLIMHNPFDMRPFFGYNFSDYLTHWLSMKLRGEPCYKDSAMGLLPCDNSINIHGLKKSFQLEQLLDMPKEFWQQGIKESEEFFSIQVEKHLPQSIANELQDLK